MQTLQDLPNISKIISAKLRDAEISTSEQLFALGSKEAFLKIRTRDPGACLNMLYSLEGAVRGILWHNLSDQTKAELKDFHRSL